MQAKVLVLGGTGMLGSAVTKRLRSSDFLVTSTARDPSHADGDAGPFAQFSVGGSALATLVEGYGPGDFVVNCIGLIRHRMNDTSQADRLEAIRVNAEFPYTLAHLAEQQKFRVIQIATDCVYAGTLGAYNEGADHDARDVYGKSKSLGEVPSPHVLNLRCSIIGRELEGNTSLVGWLLSQPRNASIQGYEDHRWNGITTNVFADITAGLISSGSDMHGSFHVVPADAVNKYKLSTLVLRAFGREDVIVEPTKTGRSIDRTLSTLHTKENQTFWSLAGYPDPASIEQMVIALSDL